MKDSERRFAAHVVEFALRNPHLNAEEVAGEILGPEPVHVALVTEILVDAGRDPDGELDLRDDEETIVIELIEQNDVLENHGRTRSEGARHAWRPLEIVEVDANLADAESGGPALLPRSGERVSTKRTVDRPRKHGTAYTYEKLKCRCDACRAYKSERNAREYRERKKRIQQPQ